MRIKSFKLFNIIVKYPNYFKYGGLCKFKTYIALFCKDLWFAKWLSRRFGKSMLIKFVL